MVFIIFKTLFDQIKLCQHGWPNNIFYHLYDYDLSANNLQVIKAYFHKSNYLIQKLLLGIKKKRFNLMLPALNRYKLYLQFSYTWQCWRIKNRSRVLETN